MTLISGKRLLLLETGTQEVINWLLTSQTEMAYGAFVMLLSLPLRSNGFSSFYLSK